MRRRGRRHHRRRRRIDASRRAMPCPRRRSSRACCRSSRALARRRRAGVDRHDEAARDARSHRRGRSHDQRRERAARSQGALEAVAASGAAVCLMHMQGAPRTMQTDAALRRRRRRSAGLPARARRARARRPASSGDRIVLDPGFGFGKTSSTTCCCSSGCRRWSHSAIRCCAGWSRKSSLGKLTGRAPDERDSRRASPPRWRRLRTVRSLVRVHDVRETRRRARGLGRGGVGAGGGIASAGSPIASHRHGRWPTMPAPGYARTSRDSSTLFRHRRRSRPRR